MEKRLGMGLESLFGNIDESNEGKIEKVSMDLIQIAKWQPRKTFDETALNELAASIKEYGVLQPIILKQYDDHYEIIAGERRYRASKMIGLIFIPAIIMDFDDQKSLEVSMIENLQRKDLTPIEQAEGFKFLIEKLNLTQEELSEKLGFSRSYIANFLRINGLSDRIKSKIAQGELSVGHAKILVNKENAEELATEVVSKKLTVRQLEELVNVQPKKNTSNSDVSQFETMLQDALNQKVRVVMKKDSGQIIIDFHDLNALDAIISKICF